MYKKIIVERTGRYIVLGEVSEKTKNIWVCFHGYGQLASYFSKKFETLLDEKTCVIIPEGLSRFYLNGNYDRIGASWLTKEMREEEIVESLNFVNSIFDSVASQTGYIKLNVLGFSQGCAMACRWLNQIEKRADNLILWAGFFNNGIEDVINVKKLSSTKCFYVYGIQDEFLVQNPEMKDKMYQNLRNQLKVEEVPYEGTHRMEVAVLQKLIQSLQ